MEHSLRVVRQTGNKLDAIQKRAWRKLAGLVAGSRHTGSDPVDTHTSDGLLLDDGQPFRNFLKVRFADDTGVTGNVSYFGGTGVLRKLTRSPRSVAFRVGHGIPNS